MEVEKMIYELRGLRVILDSDLAELYGVETRIFNRNVKRNLERFPEDFMFQLTESEDFVLRSQIGISSETHDSLRSQFAISKKGKGGRRYQPFIFEWPCFLVF